MNRSEMTRRVLLLETAAAELRARAASVRADLNADARAELAEQGMAPTWRWPDIGSVSLPISRESVVVDNEDTFLDWIRVTFPTEVERTERVRPAFFTALSQTVTQVGEDVVHTGTGEIVPGLRIRPGGEPGSLSFRISAGAKAVAAEAAGRLIDELTAGLGLEAPDAAP